MKSELKGEKKGGKENRRRGFIGNEKREFNRRRGY